MASAWDFPYPQLIIPLPTVIGYLLLTKHFLHYNKAGST
jgi:hypothetical protein